MISGFFLTHFLEYMYAPGGHAFWEGAIWANVVVITVIAPLGWLWSRTRFWPLRPFKHMIGKIESFREEHRAAHKALHAKLDKNRVHLETLHDSHDELHEKLDKLHEKVKRLL